MSYAYRRNNDKNNGPVFVIGKKVISGEEISIVYINLKTETAASILIYGKGAYIKDGKLVIVDNENKGGLEKRIEGYDKDLINIGREIAIRNGYKNMELIGVIYGNDFIKDLKEEQRRREELRREEKKKSLSEEDKELLARKSYKGLRMGLNPYEQNKIMGDHLGLLEKHLKNNYF